MTRRSFILLTLSALGTAGAFLFSPASSFATTNTSKSTQKKQDEWVVVKIIDPQKGDEYKPVRKTDVPTEKKKLADEYKKAMADWKDARKSDPKTPRPVAAKLKVVKTGFNAQKGAEEYCDKLADEDEQKGDSKDSKKGKKSSNN